MLARQFGSRGAPGGERPAFSFPPLPQAKPTTIYLIDKPGSAQSTFSLGLPGPSRTTPDYYALQVMNTILGGMFQARLNANIREEKGYSYGVSSGFGFGKGPNPFRTGGDIVGDKSDAALVEFNEGAAGHLGARPVTEEELKTARNRGAAPAGNLRISRRDQRRADGMWVQILPDHLLPAVTNQ